MGEIYSIAYQRQWQDAKLAQLSELLNSLQALPIARKSIVEAYARIDAYSQGKDLLQPLPTGMTARNMGKNDLWIAATAYSIGASLVSTDKDFAHLDNVFFPVIRPSV